MLMGCAPPAEALLPGTIELLFPGGDDVELIDGTLMLTVVADIDNFELVDPASTSGDVDGQGHWHLFVKSDYFVVFTPTVEVEITGLQDGEVLEILGVLQSNTHEDLTAPICDPCEDRAEATVRAVSEG